MRYSLRVATPFPRRRKNGGRERPVFPSSREGCSYTCNYTVWENSPLCCLFSGRNVRSRRDRYLARVQFWQQSCEAAWRMGRRRKNSDPRRKDQVRIQESVRNRAYQGVCLAHSLGLSVFSFIGLAACHGKAQNESKPYSSHTALFSEGKGAQVIIIMVY